MRTAALVLVILHAGCLDTAPDEGDLTQDSWVVWTNPVRVITDQNSLFKNAPQLAWNAGASSVGTFTGDGYVEFSTYEADTSKMAGLSSDDTTPQYTDIDFAIHLKANGRIAIRESGVQVASDVGGYVAFDVFRVESRAGVVTYWKNGGLLHVSLVAPAPTLRADTSLYTPGCNIIQVNLVALTLHWQNVTNVVVGDGSLTKTSTTGWNAGASTIETINCCTGYVEFSTNETSTNKVAGLSGDDSSVLVADIDLGLRLRADGTVGVVEKGHARGLTLNVPYAPGDVFRVEIIGPGDTGNVKYSKNGVVFWQTFNAQVIYPLRVDASLYTSNATITNVTLH